MVDPIAVLLVRLVIAGPHSSENAIQEPERKSPVEITALRGGCDLTGKRVQLAQIGEVRRVVRPGENLREPRLRIAIVGFDLLDPVSEVTAIRQFDRERRVPGDNELLSHSANGFCLNAHGSSPSLILPFIDHEINIRSSEQVNKSARAFSQIYFRRAQSGQRIRGNVCRPREFDSSRQPAFFNSALSRVSDMA